MPPTMAPSTNRLNMALSFSGGYFVDGPLDPGAAPDLVPTGSQRDHEGFAPLPPVLDFPKGVARSTIECWHPAHRTPPLSPAASVLAQSGHTSSSASPPLRSGRGGGAAAPTPPPRPWRLPTAAHPDHPDHCDRPGLHPAAGYGPAPAAAGPDGPCPGRDRAGRAGPAHPAVPAS